MEKSSKFAERVVNTAVVLPEFNERERAKDLIRDIAGHCWNGRGDMIDRVYDVIRKAYPKVTWTRRRVRALWHREAAGVRWHEMRELEVVAELERANRKTIEEARREHAEFIAKTARLEALLSRSDEDFHCDQIEALGRLYGGMDRPGNQRVDE